MKKQRTTPEGPDTVQITVDITPAYLMGVMGRKCLDCCGGSKATVRGCRDQTCALWPFRTGKALMDPPPEKATRKRRMVPEQETVPPMPPVKPPKSKETSPADEPLPGQITMDELTPHKTTKRARQRKQVNP